MGRSSGVVMRVGKILLAEPARMGPDLFLEHLDSVDPLSLTC